MWRREKEITLHEERELPLLLTSALDQLDGASLIIAPGEVAIFSNLEADKLGILRDGRIAAAAAAAPRLRC